jgi:hypothetical protein
VIGWIPAASASSGGTYEQTVTDEAVLCSATSTDGSLFVRTQVRRTSLGDDYFSMRAYDTGSGDLRYKADALGSWADGQTRGRGDILDAQDQSVDGEVYLSASFQPVGDPVEEVVSSQAGNMRMVVTHTTQEYGITNPILTVTGFDMGSIDCFGNRIVTHTKSTTPATYIDNDRTLGTTESHECSLPNGGDVAARVDRGRLTLTVSELPGDPYTATGTLPLRGSSGTGQLTLTDSTGAQIGTADATASVVKAGKSTTESFSEGGVVVVQTVTPYRLSLDLALPETSVTATCDMQLVSARLRVHLL